MMGNWNTLATFPAGLSQTRTHNKANEIATIVGPTGVPTPAFDLAGNMTTVPSGYDWTTSLTCKWDAWNRLVQVGPIVYTYDAMSRRVKNGTGDTFYDRQWRAVEERDSTAVKAQYTWSPFDRWTLMRRKRSVSGTLDETRWSLKDDLNPVAVTDGTGLILARFSYDAFGTIFFLSATYQTTAFNVSDWNFLFHGEFLDSETAWYNYGYRYYSPRLGRWLSRDPILERGGANLYSYSENSPVNNLDFLGLSSFFDVSFPVFEAIGEILLDKIFLPAPALPQSQGWTSESKTFKGLCICCQGEAGSSSIALTISLQAAFGVNANVFKEALEGTGGISLGASITIDMTVTCGQGEGSPGNPICKRGEATITYDVKKSYNLATHYPGNTGGYPVYTAPYVNESDDFRNIKPPVITFVRVSCPCGN